MTTRIHCCECQPSAFQLLCVICGSKAIGMNFGALTCAPCKGMNLSFHLLLSYSICFKIAFFRRNARRTEVRKTICLFNKQKTNYF